MAGPVTLHIALTAGQRVGLRRRLRQHALSSRLRRRLECIRLADQGWPALRIAAHLGVNQATVTADHHLQRHPATCRVRPGKGPR